MPLLFFVLLGVVLLGSTVGAGRSPHVLYRPEQITTRLDDVVGIDPVKEDVVRSLNLFLAHKQFSEEMGGTPRRGLLFEGAPGTGKTHLAKAMAAEAGVPFLFVSATSFQSMYYGATARKIRSYFKKLRKVARQEGGAIGFIEEIDAIAMARGGLSATPLPDSVRAVSHACGGLHTLPSSFAHVAPGRQRGHQPERHERRCRRRGQRAAGADAVVRRADRWPEAADVGRRQDEPAAARAPPDQASRAAAHERAAHRCDQPGRQPRPRAAASGPLRPSPDLRAARQGGSSSADRPLPARPRRTRPSWTSTAPATRSPRPPPATRR